MIDEKEEQRATFRCAGTKISETQRDGASWLVLDETAAAALLWVEQRPFADASVARGGRDSP